MPRCTIDPPSLATPAVPRRLREAALALDFLRDQPLNDLALALFNLNGFLDVPGILPPCPAYVYPA